MQRTKPGAGHSATGVAGLHAGGDIRGKAQFTYTAYDDFLVLRSRFLGDATHVTRRVTPYAIMNADVDPATLRNGVHVHPTLAEGVHQAVAAICAA